MPTTTMPSIENDSSIARMFSQVRKYGDAKLMPTHSTAMISSRPASRMLPSRKGRFTASPLAPAAVPVPAVLAGLVPSILNW